MSIGNTDCGVDAVMTLGMSVGWKKVFGDVNSLVMSGVQHNRV